MSRSARRIVIGRNIIIEPFGLPYHNPGGGAELRCFEK